MGYVRCRETKLKKRRYTALYKDVRGVERSAGTFGVRAAAARAWKCAEAAVVDGRYLDVDQGRKRFAEYARDTWLPQYAGEDSTVEGYGFYLEKYLIPEFGATRMIEVTPGRVRAFYALLRDAGLGRPTAEKCKTVLCSLFNTAVNDRVVGVHPCRGVGIAAVVQAKLRILSPPEYAQLHAHLRDDYARLMVDVLLETGCRWGEFAELRVGDLDTLACTVTVARTVVEVKARYVPEGESGFQVKQYPKNRHWRTVAISRPLADRLAAHLSGRGRGALMFPAVGRPSGRRSEPGDASREPEVFKLNGRSFTHGTLYAYTKGECRCEACREEMAAYRAARRGSGKDRPPKTQVPEAVREARHMRRDWFRYRVLGPAVEAAGLDWRVRTHDLRHASASWALAGGATVQQVREHLGHVSLRAVERYLHNLPGADAGAAGAIARVKATGALYPVITPSYSPTPTASVAVDVVSGEAEGPDTPATAQPTRPTAPGKPAATTEAQPQIAESSNPVSSSTDGTALVIPESVSESVSESASSPAGHSTDTAEELAAASSAPLSDETPLRRDQTASDQRTKKKHRVKSPRQTVSPRADHVNDDRHATDKPTTLQVPDDGGNRSIGGGTPGRTPNQPTVKAAAPVTWHDGGAGPALQCSPESGGGILGESTHQASKLLSQPNRREDPLTNDGQRIKKPVPSTTGDRL